MCNVDVTKLDELLAAYDWYLFLRETDDQPLRFGTVTTQWKDMGAYRDFCFISELFPADPTKWSQNSVVADSVLKMHLITTYIGNVGSSFPYCKAMGIVSKSDLSITEHAIMHNFIHRMEALLANTRSCNSPFESNSIARNDVCFAALCIMATGALKASVQLDDDQSRIINTTTVKALKLNVQEVTTIPDYVSVWIKTYNESPEPGTFEWWISGLMLNPLFLLISRLNSACFPHEFNLQIN